MIDPRLIIKTDQITVSRCARNFAFRYFVDTFQGAYTSDVLASLLSTITKVIGDGEKLPSLVAAIPLSRVWWQGRFHSFMSLWALPASGGNEAEAYQGGKL